jgi:hypothetical protein
MIGAIVTKVLEAMKILPDWGKAFVLAGALVVIVLSIHGTAAASEARVAVLETKTDKQAEEIRDLRAIITRMEGKLDIILIRTAK